MKDGSRVLGDGGADPRRAAADDRGASPRRGRGVRRHGVAAQGAQGTFTTATAWWPKTTFDRWWAGGRAFAVALASPTLGTFESVTVKAAASCAPDSWTPVGRSAAAAVWTGIEMIVWGGTNGNGPIVLNDGARYNPSTDRTPARRSCSSSAGARRIGGRVRVSGKPLPFQTVPVSGPFQEGFI
jgi:hypothetical protein